MLDKIKNKHLLVDGDIIKYRCAASAEKTKYLLQVLPPEGTWYFNFDSHKDAAEKARLWMQEDPQSETYIWSRKEIQPVEFALEACKACVDSLISKLHPSRVSIFLSPKRTFRDDIARTKPYKGNRTQEKPKYLKDVENYLIKGYGATVADYVEADDEIGKNLSIEGDGAVSVSIDKDLLQVPGWHYNWVNDRIQRISPREGDFNFYTQMLTGDTTDNIPGISGIGAQGASKILSGAKSRDDLCTRVWMCYRGEFNDTQKARRYFLEQAQLLWILHGDPKLIVDTRIPQGGQYIVPDGCKLQ